MHRSVQQSVQRCFKYSVGSNETDLLVRPYAPKEINHIGNDLILFNIKNDKTIATLIHMYIELVISKPTTMSV